MPQWLVLDMDEGVLRRVPGNAAGKEWFASLNGARPSQVRAYRRGPGDYELHVYEDHEIAGQAWLLLAGNAARHGWNPDQVPLYPLPGEPFERVEREPQPVTLTPAQAQSLSSLLHYNWVDEGTDYHRQDRDGQENHIYRDMLALHDALAAAGDPTPTDQGA